MKDKEGCKNLVCKCSCIAGSPTCKHIIGSLTDLKWKKKRLKMQLVLMLSSSRVKAMYSYVPMKKHCHDKQKDCSKVRQMITIGIKEFAFNLMVIDHPDSLLSVSLNGIQKRADVVLPLEDPVDKFLTA
ncbi:hypothetical protein QAD02_000938 [Eretmocerus hayati]|uniref:Uncharacterized protein n=1 Tax=Eretmocerus hayati TaxID=131215 RepID=A0ACC2NH63_9HYME|nr:hypothetical protein QAD02_000938 [Eretmocerus hayati]